MPYCRLQFVPAPTETRNEKQPAPRDGSVPIAAGRHEVLAQEVVAPRGVGDHAVLLEQIPQGDPGETAYLKSVAVAIAAVMVIEG